MEIIGFICTPRKTGLKMFAADNIQMYIHLNFITVHKYQYICTIYHMYTCNTTSVSLLKQFSDLLLIHSKNTSSTNC